MIDDTYFNMPLVKADIKRILTDDFITRKKSMTLYIFHSDQIKIRSLVGVRSRAVVRMFRESGARY